MTSLRFRHAVPVAALLAALPLAAQEPVPAGPVTPATTARPDRGFTFAPHAGFMRFSVVSGLENAPGLGLDARYDLTPSIAIGTSVNVIRANTRGSDFVTAFRYGDPSKGDTTFIFRLQQPVTLLDAALNATFQVPSFSERLAPYVTGGAGIYTFFLDPQANAGAARDFSRMSALLGGGVRLRVSQAAGITLDVRDMVLTNFDRNRLAPSDARFRGNVFPEDFAPPPLGKDVVHNILYSIGFTWTPQRGPVDGEAER